MALLFIFLLWSRFCHLLIVSRFLSLGLVSCLVFKPFKPRPVFGFCMCPFFCVWFVSPPPCFLLSSLSLSLKAGETQTPFAGFGVPLVSLFAAHALRPRPVLQGPHLHQGVAPHLPFLFFFRRRRSFSGSVSSRFGHAGVCFLGGGSWSLVLVFAW